MPQVPAIETNELRKEFGDNAAVKCLTLQIQQGEVFGFLGPNGAGKTTSIKMLVGLIAPTSGKAALLGAPLGDRTTRARIGFLPEHFRFQEWLTAREFLSLHGNLFGMENRRLTLRIDERIRIVRATLLQLGVLLGQAVEGCVRTDPHLRRQCPSLLVRCPEVLDDSRIVVQ